MQTHFESLKAAIYKAREGPPHDLTLENAGTLAALKQLCEEHKDSKQPKKLRAVAVEFLLDWDVIIRQVREPFLPLTNNASEQSLRHWVISRLMSHGTRCPDGSRAFALLASVIETCRLREANPWHYLTSVIAASRKGLEPPSLPQVKVSVRGV